MIHDRMRVVVGAVLAACALMVGSAVTAQAAPPPSPSNASSAEQHRIEVSATGGWQGDIWVLAGTWVNIQAPSVGRYWTVDYRPEANLQYVGGQGYRGEPVWGGNPACKADPEYPYGALLARLDGVRAVNGATQFMSRGSGYMNFSINDLERCQWDNAGSLPITVTIG